MKQPYKINQLLKYIFLSIIIFTDILFANSISLNLTQEEQNYITNKKILKVHVEKDWIPFNFIQNSQPKGFANDYMKLLGNKLGLNIEFVSGFTWAEHINMLKTNEIDVISAATITPNRKKSYIFSDKSIFDIFISLVTLEDNKKLTLNQLSGKKLAVVKGYNSSETLRKYYPQIKLVEVDSNFDILKLILNKKVDAGLGNYAVLKYIMKKNFFTNSFNSNLLDNEYFKRTPQHIALNKNKLLLKQIIDKGILAISTKELNILQNKWNSNLNRVNSIFTEEEIVYLRNKKELTVCVKPNLLPYEAIKNGKYVGISADYLNLISKKLNISFKVMPSETNADTLKLVKNKKCDIQTLIMINQTKLPYKPTKAYIEDYISLITNIQQPFINNLDEYMDKKFVMTSTQRGIIRTVKKLYPKIKIIFAKSTNEALQMVENKKVFGFIGKSLSSIHNIQKHYPSKLKVINEFKKANLGIGVVEDNKILLNIMNKALDAIDEKNKIKIRNSWTITTIEKIVDYTFVWYILIVVSIIILAFIYRQITLKKINKELVRIVEIKTKKLIDLNKNLEKEVEKRTAELKRLATTDALTSIHNRYSLMKIFSTEIHRSQRYNNPLSILMLDIDYFKKINDTYGHNIGDEVLIAFSNLLQNSLRDIDIVGRYGGEEFLIILPNTILEKAKIFSERLRQKIDKYPFDTVGNVTVSIGLVELRTDETTIDDIFARVDILLYKSKKNGRNRVSY